MRTNRKEAMVTGGGQKTQLIRHYLDDFRGGHDDKEAALRQINRLISVVREITSRNPGAEMLSASDNTKDTGHDI